jgi:hypothetical protein
MNYEESDYQKTLDALMKCFLKADKSTRFFVMVDELVNINSELTLLKNILIFQILKEILSNDKEIVNSIKHEHIMKILNSAFDVNNYEESCECNTCDYKRVSKTKTPTCKQCKKEIVCMSNLKNNFPSETPKIMIENDEDLNDITYSIVCSQKCSLEYADDKWKMTHL